MKFRGEILAIIIITVIVILVAVIFSLMGSRRALEDHHLEDHHLEDHQDLVIHYYEPIHPEASRETCGSAFPGCGLTPAEAQAQNFPTQQEIIDRLIDIKNNSKVPISVGPLIKNGNNGGLIDIDVNLDMSLGPEINVDICGPNTSPTIREAVICTVTNDPLGFTTRGNTDPAKIGLTTQNRVIWAARIGHGGTRVLMTNQVHGDEASNSEAALRLLKTLTQSTSSKIKNILEKLDILIIPRINVDGGDPLGNNDPVFGEVYTETTGFIRHNVDPAAGGAYVEPSEPNFFGVVGRGYDLNRYVFANLKFAIRPPECQAIVSVMHAFRPNHLSDHHQTVTVANIEPNLATLTNGTVEALSPAPPVITPYDTDYAAWYTIFLENDECLPPPDQRQSVTRTTRSVGGKCLDKMKDKIEGQVMRYAQFTGGTGLVNQGRIDAGCRPLGVNSVGVEIKGTEFLRPDVLRTTLVNGEWVFAIGLNTGFIDPCFASTAVCVSEEAQMVYLESVIEVLKEQPVKGDSSWCSYPFVNVLNAPQIELGPESSQPGFYFGPGGVSYVVFGTCAGDSTSCF